MSECSVKKKSSNKKAFSQLVLMMILTLVTQVVALLKTSTIASQFGATLEMDAFNFSNSVGTFIFSFIGAGITTVLIPTLSRDEDDKSVNVFISVLYSLAFIVLIIIYLFRVPMIRVLTSREEQFVLIASNVMLITLITQFVNSFMGTTNAIFQCKGKFNFPKLMNLAMTIILVLLIVFSSNITIYKYAFYICITTLINVVIQIFLAVRSGFKFRYKLDLKDPNLKRNLKIFGPTALSTGLYQVSLITDTIISSNLGEGQVSILAYSNTIMTMINAILLGNLITYLYPKIAKGIDKEDSQKKLFDLVLLLNCIMFIIVVGFWIVGREGIILLYERGKFTSEITSVVFICTCIYMIGLPINAFRDLVYRYFYAKGDTYTPFKNSLTVSMLNIIISIILSRLVGIYGIILGTVITSYISLAMILFRFKKKFKFNFKVKMLIVENIKLLVAAVSVLGSFFILNMFIPQVNIIVKIIFNGVAILIMYGALIYIFKSRVLKIKL